MEGSSHHDSESQVPEYQRVLDEIDLSDAVFRPERPYHVPEKVELTRGPGITDEHLDWVIADATLNKARSELLQIEAGAEAVRDVILISKGGHPLQHSVEPRVAYLAVRFLDRELAKGRPLGKIADDMRDASEAASAKLIHEYPTTNYSENRQ